MRRRDWLSGAAALAATSAGAQQPGRSYRIGWLSPTSRREPYAVAMVGRLAELGFVEGRNLVIEFRSGPAREEVYRTLAAELGRMACDLYFAPGNPIGLEAVRQMTRDAPIITVANDFDPISAGFVASLARPGGRITGVSQLITELPAKRLEVARELVPGLKRVAMVADPVTRGQLDVSRAAAARLGLELVVHEYATPPYDLPAAFARFTAAKVDALVPLASGFFAARRQAIVDVANRHRLPAVYPNAVWVEAGGLLGYGPDFTASYRRVAEIASRLLLGADPATTPMEQAQVVELVLNRRTARLLGLAVPQAIELRADRIVE